MADQQDKREPASGPRSGPIGGALLQSLLSALGRAVYDPDISSADVAAIRRLLRTQPGLSGLSGPILSIACVDPDERPAGCAAAAAVFRVMTGIRSGPLAGRGECFTIAKDPDGQMTVAERQAWVG